MKIDDDVKKLEQEIEELQIKMVKLGIELDKNEHRLVYAKLYGQK